MLSHWEEEGEVAPGEPPGLSVSEGADTSPSSDDPSDASSTMALNLSSTGVIVRLMVGNCHIREGTSSR